MKSQSFPTLVLAALIVAAGIYVVEGFDGRAAWLLAFLVLLGVAFGYKDFGNELTGLLSGAQVKQQTTSSAPQVKPPADIVVGPLGPITA